MSKQNQWPPGQGSRSTNTKETVSKEFMLSKANLVPGRSPKNN